MILGVVGIAGCNGDTPAAGSCIVAFGPIADALAAAGPSGIDDEIDEDRGLRAAERTLYWCEDVDEWQGGVLRLRARLKPEASEDRLDDDLPETTGLLLGLFCPNDAYSRAPVCRDARRVGVEFIDFGEAIEAAFESLFEGLVPAGAP